MVKRVKVKTHVRDGVLIEEHDREVDEAKSMTLEERIRKKRQDEEKQAVLFGK